MKCDWYSKSNSKFIGRRALHRTSTKNSNHQITWSNFPPLQKLRSRLIHQACNIKLCRFFRIILIFLVVIMLFLVLHFLQLLKALFLLYFVSHWFLVTSVQLIAVGNWLKIISFLIVLRGVRRSSLRAVDLIRSLIYSITASVFWAQLQAVLMLILSSVKFEGMLLE